MSSNQKQTPKPIEFFSHYLDKWDSDTKHMTATQEGIYCRLRSLYFKSAGVAGQNGRIADDFELLCFRIGIGCHGDSERADLAWLLKDKFKKINKYYRHDDWDRQIKNIRHVINNADTKSNAKSNGGNGGGVTSCNVGGNADIYEHTTRYAMTQAERTEKSRKLKVLINKGVQADKSMTLDEIRSLYETNFKSGNGSGVTSCNVGGNTDGNACNAQNPANTNNLQLTTNNLKNECVKSETLHAPTHTNFSKNLNSIKDWQAPKVDMVNQLLAKAGFGRQLNQDEFIAIFDKFINYNVSREIQGAFLATEQVRIDKLIDWIKREKPVYTPHSATPASDNSNNLWRDDSLTTDTVISTFNVGGFLKTCFDGYNPTECGEILEKYRLAGETRLEAYDRIKRLGVANCVPHTPASDDFVKTLFAKTKTTKPQSRPQARA